MTRDRSHRWTKLVLTLAAIGAVIGIAIAVVLIVGRNRLSSRIDAIRARGEPTSPNEIHFDVVTAPSDLAAKAQAFRAALEAAAELSIEMPDMNELKAWTPLGPGLKEVQEFVDCVESSRRGDQTIDDFGWDALQAAARDPRHVEHLSDCERLGLNALAALREPLVPLAKETCTARRDTAEGRIRDLKTDDFQPDVRDFLAPWFAGRTLVETIPALVLRGDFDEAMSRLDVTSRGSESIEGLPWFLGYLGWCASALGVVKGCECILANTSEPLDWRTVPMRIRAMRTRENFERGLVGERAFGMRIFSEYVQGASETSLGHGIDSGVGFALLESYDYAFYLDHMSKEIERARMPLPLPDFAPEPWEVSPSEAPHWAILTGFLMPKIREARERTIMLETQVRLAQIGIEANVHGADAAMRMAKTVMDPYDGNPVRARLDDNTLFLWSVGPDRIDQSRSSTATNAGPYSTDEPTDDIVWRVRVR